VTARRQQLANAHHEAGHFVVALASGFRPMLLSLRPLPPYRSGPFVSAPGPRHTYRQVRAHAVTAAAGLMAELRAGLASSDTMAGARNDLKQARKAARQLCGRRWRLALDRYVGAARMEVDRLWPAISALADESMRFPRIEARHAYLVIRRALGERHLGGALERMRRGKARRRRLRRELARYAAGRRRR